MAGLETERVPGVLYYHSAANRFTELGDQNVKEPITMQKAGKKGGSYIS